jgi:uncharacterized protein with FMN-binding domain
MKRIVTWFLSTVTVVVLMFGYHTSTSGALTAQDTVVPSTADPGSSNAAGSGGSAGSQGSGRHSGAAQGPQTITGPVVQTQWGPVQVAITTQGGKITDVAVPQHPSGNANDQAINDYALPILVDETLNAQSANIDMVSGATVTSGGYIQSLQAALDEARL